MRIDKVIQVRIVKIKSLYIGRVNILIRSLVRGKSLVLTGEKRRKGKKSTSRGKAPPYISFLPLLLTNPKPSTDFHEFLSISNIFAKTS